MPAALVAAFSYDSRVLLERYVDGRDLAGVDPRRRPAARGGGGAAGGGSTTSRRATRSAAPSSSQPRCRTASGGRRSWRCGPTSCWAARRSGGSTAMLGADGELTVLEANPIPGLTETSAAAGSPRPRGSPSTTGGTDRRARARARPGLSRSSSSSSPSPVGGEVLGCDVVEERPNFLDDLLDARTRWRTRNHVLGGEDGRAGANSGEASASEGLDQDLAAV